MASPTFYDNFVNSSGSDVNITSHTPTSGTGTYTISQGAYAISPTGFIRNNANAQSYVNIPATFVPSGTTISFDLQVPSNIQDFLGISMGGTSTANPYGGGVELRYNMANNSLNIYRMDTVASLASEGVTLVSASSSNPTKYHFEFSASVTGNITVSINGAPQLTTAWPTGGSALTYGTNINIETGVTSGVVPTDTSGIQISNLYVYQTTARNVTPVDQTPAILSPNNQYINPGVSTEWIHTGTSLKIATTGTYLGLQVNDTLLSSGGIASGGYPSLVFSLDGGPWTHATIPAVGSNQIINLTSGSPTYGHSVEVRLEPGDESDSWTPKDALLITGIVSDYGTATTISPTGNATARPKKMMVIGDSITRGYNAISIGGFTCLQNFAQIAADALNAEVGIVGYSGQGWTKAATAVAPAFPSTWNAFDSTHTKTLHGLDYLVIAQGTNDGAASAGAVQSAIASTLPSIRTAIGPSTLMVILLPPSGQQATAITAAVNAYKATDGNVLLVDLSNRKWGFGVNGGQTPNPFSQYTWDGVHPTTQSHAMIGAALAQAIASFNASQTGSGAFISTNLGL